MSMLSQRFYRCSPFFLKLLFIIIIVLYVKISKQSQNLPPSTGACLMNATSCMNLWLNRIVYMYIVIFLVNILLKRTVDKLSLWLFAVLLLRFVHVIMLY